jgi:hypothetical protein
MAVHHIYTLVAVPEINCQHTCRAQSPSPSKGLTLYPAAYPSPGNNEKNFLPTETEALSLKITWFNWDADDIYNASVTPPKVYRAPKSFRPFRDCSSDAWLWCRPSMDQYHCSQQDVTQYLLDGTQPIQQCQQNLQLISKSKASLLERTYLNPTDVLKSIRSCSLWRP